MGSAFPYTATGVLRKPSRAAAAAGSLRVGAWAEPSTLAMGGIGGLLALGYAWRRRRAA